MSLCSTRTLEERHPNYNKKKYHKMCLKYHPDKNVEPLNASRREIWKCLGELQTLSGPCLPPNHMFAIVLNDA